MRLYSYTLSQIDQQIRPIQQLICILNAYFQVCFFRCHANYCKVEAWSTTICQDTSLRYCLDDLLYLESHEQASFVWHILWSFPSIIYIAPISIFQLHELYDNMFSFLNIEYVKRYYRYINTSVLRLRVSWLPWNCFSNRHFLLLKSTR